MEVELTDVDRTLRDTFRNYFTREREPRVEAMDRGDALPYDHMRAMHRTLGLDAIVSRAGRRPRQREAAPKAGQAPAGGLDANTARYPRTTFVVEMARVSRIRCQGVLPQPMWVADKVPYRGRTTIPPFVRAICVPFTAEG